MFAWNIFLAFASIFLVDELYENLLLVFFGICDTLRDLVSFLQSKKRMKNTHGEMLLLVNLQTLVCIFIKINTSP